MTSFVDEVRVSLRAGDGGPGAASFARTKHRPKGKPDGGSGGHGGSVVLLSDPSVGSLSSFVHRRHHRATGGTAGGPNSRRGADADDVVLTVPVGTIVRQGDEVLADLAKAGATYVGARGGRGGRGNASLRSRHERNPNHAELGEPGQAAELTLELRLVADVGLLGPPNAGKSTLLAAISRADPKIADYPFTTIDPGLGVVVPDLDADPFVVADLPGLIEGAAGGRGLGLRFLRHATRCGVLAAVVDLAAPDPVGDLEAVTGELVAYDAELLARLRLVVGNKIDLDPATEEDARAWANARGARFVAISAREAANLDGLRSVLAEAVTRAKLEQGEQRSFAVFRPVQADRIVVRREGEGFRVSSERVERMVAQTPLGSPGAVRRLQRRLRTMGVETALLGQGAEEGDDVYIGEAVFEFFPEESARA